MRWQPKRVKYDRMIQASYSFVKSMGVYVFRSRHHPVIKVGSHIGSNAWGRVINRGFFSVLRPEDIKEKVDVADLELLYWFPALTITEEHLLHYKLREFRVVGEWFTVAALEKIPEYITLPNRAATCVIPGCSARSTAAAPASETFTKFLDLTMEAVGDPIEMIIMPELELVKPQKLGAKNKSKKIPEKVIYRTINTLTSEEINQCISLMENVCEECSTSVFYSLRSWGEKHVCLACFTQLSDKIYEEINAYIHKKGYNACTICIKPRADYSAFSKDWVNIWSKGKLLGFPQYSMYSIEEIKDIIDHGSLVCVSCYTVVCSFEYKYGYRKKGDFTPCKGIDDYDDKMTPIFDLLRLRGGGQGWGIGGSTLPI